MEFIVAIAAFLSATVLPAWVIATLVKPKNKKNRIVDELPAFKGEEKRNQKVKAFPYKPSSVKRKQQKLLFAKPLGLTVVLAIRTIGILPEINKRNSRNNVSQGHDNQRGNISPLSSGLPTLESSSGHVDPASQIKKYFTFYSDPEYLYLNNESEYSKTAGDLARIQEKMITNRSRARDYPHMLIGSGKFRGTCNIQKPTLGTYLFKPGCNVIQINFAAQGLIYEKPIEISTVLAHE